MKKGGFSFSAAGGHTPRDDSARSDRKENALPGCEVPPLSPHICTSGRWKEEWIQAEVVRMVAYVYPNIQ